MDKPLVSRRQWHYVEYTYFIEGTHASTLPPPPFATSLSAIAFPAVLDEAQKLYAESANQKDPAKAVELLSKLITDPRMKCVWTELYKKQSDDNEATGVFVNPIYVTHRSKAGPLRLRESALRKTGGAENLIHAKVLEAELTLLEKETYDPLAHTLAHTSWTEQDFGVQLFLWQIYHAALDPKPVFLSKLKAEVKALRKAANQLREQAVTLQSLRIECGTLEQIASDCDWQARVRERNPKTDDPWIITRRVSRDPRRKTLVATLLVIME
jgi:hypothetical protein